MTSSRFSDLMALYNHYNIDVKKKRRLKMDFLDAQIDLAEFVRRYAKPYDPAADDYRRPPFAAPIKARISPLDDIHSYHTRVPPQGIEPYIKHYTEPRDIILDPFCGSGMTGVAALRLGRSVILNDLSPAATHIARNYNTTVDVRLLQKVFDHILSKIDDEFTWLYGTICDRCGGVAEIQYTIWSDVFECGRCGAELILWDLAVDEKSNSINENFECPVCHKAWKKDSLHRLRSTPVITNYDCPRCNPHRSEHRITDAEKSHVQDIASTPIPYPYPQIPFDQSFEMWRRVHSDLGITDSSKFFTSRNLWAFARLWYEADALEDTEIGEKIKYILTGSVPSLTVMTIFMPDRSGRGNRKGTLYVPSLSIEQNVKQVVVRRSRRVIKYLATLKQGNIFVRMGHAGLLPEVPTASIDYIFTDPPFGSNIFYADVNFIWESWLGKFTNQEYEAVVHIKHKDKNSLPDYKRLMTEAFLEMYRVLKPGRWASVVFHNSDDGIWQTILDAAERAGLELVETNVFDKDHLTFKGIRGVQGVERVTNKDIVLNLCKPGHNAIKRGTGSKSAHHGEIEARVALKIADYLTSNPPPEKRTLQHFWNVVLYDMLAEGIVDVSMERVATILPHYFKQVDGRWYLRGETVAGGNVFDLKSDAGAIAWLTAVLSSKPQTTGDLIPNWQSTTATLQGGDVEPGRLERLLEQNFWLDKRTNRWRIPIPAEREQMSAAQDITAQAHLRTIRRFLDGEGDHRPNTRELAAWLQFTYNRGAYAETVALYNHLDESQLEPEYAQSIRKMVQVSRIKVGSIYK